MALQLRDHLSFCACNGRLIFLDLEADRYFYLGPALETSFKLWAASPVRDEDEEEFGLLRERGLLVQARRTPPDLHPAKLSRATHDLNEDRAPRLRDVGQALTAELVAAAWLRRRPLISILRPHGIRMRQSALTAEEAGMRAKQIAAAFARSALILGSSDRCLARALAAKSLCRRRGLSATLVLGVQVNPFAAHSWVQLGKSVLVGDFEQARLFTPILSVQ